MITMPTSAPKYDLTRKIDSQLLKNTENLNFVADRNKNISELSFMKQFNQKVLSDKMLKANIDFKTRNKSRMSSNTQSANQIRESSNTSKPHKDVTRVNTLYLFAQEHTTNRSRVSKALLENSTA